MLNDDEDGSIIYCDRCNKRITNNMDIIENAYELDDKSSMGILLCDKCITKEELQEKTYLIHDVLKKGDKLQTPIIKQNGLLKDAETMKILNRLINDKDLDKWNEEEIFSNDFKEFDAYRIYRYFYQIRNPKIGYQSFISKLDNLDESHLFKVIDSIKYSLMNIKPIPLENADVMGLPFDNIFLDVILDGELKSGTKIRIFGLQLYFPMNREASKMIFDRDDLFLIRGCAYDSSKGFGNMSWLFSLNKGLISRADAKNKGKHPIDKTIEQIVSNLILFFNEPRITIRVHDHNNVRRMKQGKIPIPSQIETVMHYDLKNYIEKIYFSHQGEGNKLEFAYWVRGHKRKLVSPKFVNKQGQTIWVKAHLVGEGLQPPQIHAIIN